MRFLEVKYTLNPQAKNDIFSKKLEKIPTFAS